MVHCKKVRVQVLVVEEVVRETLVRPWVVAPVIPLQERLCPFLPERGFGLRHRPGVVLMARWKPSVRNGGSATSVGSTGSSVRAVTVVLP